MQNQFNAIPSEKVKDHHIFYDKYKENTKPILNYNIKIYYTYIHMFQKIKIYIKILCFVDYYAL